MSKLFGRSEQGAGGILWSVYEGENEDYTKARLVASFAERQDAWDYMQLKAEFDEEHEIRKVLQSAFGVVAGDFHIGDAKEAEALVKDALNVGLPDSGYKTREEWGEPLDGTVVGILFDLRADHKRLREALERLLQQHNDECLLCAWKDTIALEALPPETAEKMRKILKIKGE